VPSSSTFLYQKAYNTYTIEQFISCQSDTEMCYNNTSFIDNVKYPELGLSINYNTYNVLSDYIDEIRSDYCVQVILSDDELEKYIYRPKLLCHDIYGNGELAFIILLTNDICSVKQFTKKKLLMPRKVIMSELCKYLFNSDRNAIIKYNQKNK